MKRLLSTIIALLSLTASLSAHSPAQDAPKQASVQNQNGAQPAKKDEEQGEVDLLLGELERRNEQALGRCLENCKEGAEEIATGDVVAGRVIEKPQPAYPVVARAGRVSGEVSIRLVVDEEGKVMAAQAASGHPLLRAAALESVREMRFTPTLLKGRAVKVSGVITYNFVLR